MSTTKTDPSRQLVDQFLTELTPELADLPLKDAFVQLLQLARSAQAQEATACADLLRMNGDTIRLHAGEISPNEMLTIQAVLQWRERTIRSRHASQLPPEVLTSKKIADPDGFEVHWELYSSMTDSAKVSQHLTNELIQRVKLAKAEGDMTMARAIAIRDEMYTIMDQYKDYGACDTEPEVALVIALEQLIPAAEGLTR